MKTYSDAIKLLKSNAKFRIELGLERISKVLELLDNPQDNLKCIHVAGTNGKGSVCAVISTILQNAGFKIGLYTSPHIFKYNERIKINSLDISDSDFAKYVFEISNLADKNDIDLTEFEILTAIMFKYFYDNKVDVVVLETGLGGIFDATNVIKSNLCSIITHIDLDHTERLGSTKSEIAYQKAGIIKPNSQTVIFEQIKNIEDIFINECKKKNNKLHIIKNSDISNYSFDENFQYFDYKDIKNIALNLKGKAQIKNACISIETIKILNEYGYNISNSSILEGLRTVIHKGRMEKLNENPTIIYDGAHNEPAIKNLLEMTNMYYPNKKRIYIISILNRKDYTHMLKLLAEDKNAIFIMTSGNKSNKFATSDKLYDCMKKFTNEKNIFKNSLENSISDAFYDTSKNTVYFIIGSFYVYGTVIEKINELKNNSNQNKL